MFKIYGQENNYNFALKNVLIILGIYIYCKDLKCTSSYQGLSYPDHLYLLQGHSGHSLMYQLLGMVTQDQQTSGIKEISLHLMCNVSIVQKKQMGLNATKPVFGISDKARLKPVSTAMK